MEVSVMNVQPMINEKSKKILEKKLKKAEEGLQSEPTIHNQSQE